MKTNRNVAQTKPSLLISFVPFIVLFAIIGVMGAVRGTAFVQAYSWAVMLACATVAFAISYFFYRQSWPTYRSGLALCAGQVLPSVPILLLIGMVSVAWMASGVVPTLIVYGLKIINPQVFPFTACLICALVSVLSGSSWTTIATIGLAFIGIGEAMGYHLPLIAGAIISGAYFGDKVSPLSDTTVLASSTCGVDLFAHIRNLMRTSAPALLISLAAFAAIGLFASPDSAPDSAGRLIAALSGLFNISAWTLLIPVLTIVLLVVRVSTVKTLVISTIAGCVGAIVLQNGFSETHSIVDELAGMATSLYSGTSGAADDPVLADLTSTGGMLGMMPTVMLVVSAIFFGGMMIGSGMISTITGAIMRKLNSRVSLVSSTVATGVFLNAATSDQYMSIILNGNVFSDLYEKRGILKKDLSRTIEDSTSVTSVLIPWNSCGITQSTVLGVTTLAYIPFCFFNLLSPLMSVAAAWLYEMRERRRLSASVA